jgi:hypothetical protein
MCREAVGAHKLVTDVDGTPLFFSKENFSNGCIGVSIQASANERSMLGY